MDVCYNYRHSRFNDFEIRHSLRSIEQHAPYIEKVWIYGDRPGFLTEDTTLVEHVPEAATARVLDVKLPLQNCFLITFFASLIPGLASEYLHFSDDFFLLKDFPIEEARKDRYLEDLSVTPRGRGLWVDSLWRTYDTLIRLGYPGYNFETHVPQRLTRKRVLDAYCAFKDFVSEDRWYGFVWPTAVLNYALKHEQMPIYSIVEENSRGGFWGKQPSYEEVVAECEGKAFFNFDDDAFSDGVRQFLIERFPNPSKYERY
jgi:hypothetical protein